MERQKSDLVAWAMNYRGIVILITACLMAFGMYALVRMNKNEFPDFTIRQGVVVAVYPGATAEDVEQQVTKPLERYIFSYKEVKKEKKELFIIDYHKWRIQSGISIQIILFLRT